MPYCSNCGQQIGNDVKFCPGCGTPINQAHGQNQRKQSFAGDIQKCPNCGEPLTAFEALCHACGYELRNTEASSAIQRLVNELTQLEAERNKKTLAVPQRLKKQERARIVYEENSAIDSQISSTIQHFPIPNTKEDVFEFMVFAASNIDAELLDKDEYTIEDHNEPSENTRIVLARAWYKKFEQVYQKAKLVFGNSPDFNRIQEIYNEKKTGIQEYKAEKKEEEKKSNHSANMFLLGEVVVVFLLLLFLKFSL